VAAWPKLPEVRTFLRMQPDPTEDTVIDVARSAAIDYGISKYGGRFDIDSTDVPDSGHQACLQHAARLYRRRDSIDGTISWGDMGAIRVGRVDPDIEALYGVKAWMVFG
jgi:hypothetical protein